MKLIKFITVSICLTLSLLSEHVLSVSMKEFEMSLNAIRDACSPQFKITKEQLINIRKGNMNDDNKDIKCYTRCAAQMAGVLNKKGEISYQKSLAQIDNLLPTQIRDGARVTLKECINIQDNYKNACDKTFYVAKCGSESNSDFTFP